MRRGYLVVVLFVLVTSVSRGQIRVIDSLKNIIAGGKKDSLEVIADLTLSNEYARINTTAARQYALQGVALARKLNLARNLSAAYSDIITLYVQINKTDSALYYTGLLKKLAAENGSLVIRSNYYFTVGLFYRKTGDYKASIPFMKEALRLFTLENDRIGIAGQYLNIGNDYQDMGDYKNAMTYHLDALKQFEALGNKRGISFCYGEIGGDFINLQQYADALPYIKQSLALKTELQDKKGLATAYTSLGVIQKALHNPDEALNSFMTALELNRELKIPLEEAKTDLAIGRFYAGEKETGKATEYLGYSEALFKRLGDTTQEAIVNAEATNLQKTEANKQITEKTFLNTVNSAVRVGDKKTEIDNYKHLADFYEQNKQYDKALIYIKKYYSESGNSQSQELQLQVKSLEQKYNLEKEQKEIILLKKDQLLDHANLENQKIFRYGAIILIVMLLTIGFMATARYRAVQKTKRLLEMEKMRNSIARNLHDDVGSTLSSINILSNVALKQLGGNTNVSHDLQIIKESSFSIMESMSDIVWAINPANDSLEKTILKMRGFASVILEPAGISFTFQEEGKLAGLKLGLDERKNIYLIFKEAVNNIAKYSGATLTEIILQKTQHHFLMKITDNGKGFDKAKEFEGNGLKNMKSRALEMGAAFEINSPLSGGASISVSVNIP